MQYFVRELEDARAVLIAQDGYALSTFASVNDAVATCIVECRVAPLWIEWHSPSTHECVDGDSISQALALVFGAHKQTTCGSTATL